MRFIHKLGTCYYIPNKHKQETKIQTVWEWMDSQGFTENQKLMVSEGLLYASGENLNEETVQKYLTYNHFFLQADVVETPDEKLIISNITLSEETSENSFDVENYLEFIGQEVEEFVDEEPDEEPEDEPDGD